MTEIVPAENSAEELIEIGEIERIGDRDHTDDQGFKFQRTARRISRLKDVRVVIPSAYTP
jgi:hypothetical protein